MMCGRTITFFFVITLQSVSAIAAEDATYPGDTGAYQSPPPLTQEQIDDPAYWRQQMEAVRRKDANGRTLWERGRYCERQMARVNRYAEASMEWLSDHDIWFAPSRGFIPHGIVMSEQQTIRSFAEVAFRDVRYPMNNGADTDKCNEIAQYAIDRILHLMSTYPSDPTYNSRKSTMNGRNYNPNRPDTSGVEPENLQGAFFRPVENDVQ